MAAALLGAINYRGPTVLRYFAVVRRDVLHGANAYEPDARGCIRA